MTAGNRKGIVAVCFSTTLTLLVLELALRGFEYGTGYDFFHVLRTHANTTSETRLRLADLMVLSRHEDLIYELAPGIRGWFQKAPLTVNEAGWRGPELSRVRADPRILRIVCIGDSHTFGWGVGVEEAFPAVLARLHAERHPESAPLEVINLGVPGYNTAQEVASLEYKGLEYEPDLVVLFACRNDAGLANFIRVQENPFTLRRSYLYDFLLTQIRILVRAERFTNRDTGRGLARTTSRLDQHLVEGVSELDLERLPAELRSRSGLSAVRDALRRLGVLSRERRFPVVMTFLEDGVPTPLRGFMEDAGAQEGLTVVDLASPVQRFLKAGGEPMENLLLSPQDPHPTARYHRFIAETLYGQQIERQLMAVRRP